MRKIEVAEAADGTPLHYSISGIGTPIAFTHSLALDGTFWDRVVSHLPSEYASLTWDCRGHGKSGKPPGPYQIHTFADDLAAVLDHAGWNGAIIAGASMGGCVSLALAARHPAKVLALGLFDTTAGYGQEALSSWDKRGRAALEAGLTSMTGFQVSRWFTENFVKTHKQVVGQCVDVFQANDTAAYAEACSMLGRVNLYSRLSEMNIPASVVVGEEDYATPVDMAKALHSGLPNATLEIIPRARHLTPIECPERIASTLEKLGERVGR